jgi:16S rRNA (guanine527-N7)-methyltransferase
VEHAAHDPVERILREGLTALGLAAELAPRLAQLAGLVARWAERSNLTAHRSAEAVARRLVLEALALGATLPIQPPHSLADLGSGAGFPGLPLALLWPGCSVTLVESRARRHHFQRRVIRELEITNATPLHGRVEELEARPHEIVLAQAMAQPVEAIEQMRRWCDAGGWIVLPCSATPAPFAPPAGVRWERTGRYRVPPGGLERSIWIGRPISRRGPATCDT